MVPVCVEIDGSKLSVVSTQHFYLYFSRTKDDSVQNVEYSKKSGETARVGQMWTAYILLMTLEYSNWHGKG